MPIIIILIHIAIFLILFATIVFMAVRDVECYFEDMIYKLTIHETIIGIMLLFNLAYAISSGEIIEISFTPENVLLLWGN